MKTITMQVLKGYMHNQKKIIYSIYIFQVIVNDKSIIQNISKAYPSSIHDKKLFICEYKNLTNKIDKSLKILGDKGYAGLGEYQLTIPIKRNEREYKKDKTLAKTHNQLISSKKDKDRACICIYEEF